MRPVIAVLLLASCTSTKPKAYVIDITASSKNPREVRYTGTVVPPPKTHDGIAAALIGVVGDLLKSVPLIP